MANNNETEDDIYRSITSPQLIIPTPNDDKNVQPGGLASQTLQNVGNFLGITFFFINPKATILPVNCSHGFFIRGDLSDPEVQTCVDIVMEEFTTFLVENVLQIASGAPPFFTKYWSILIICYFLSV